MARNRTGQAPSFQSKTFDSADSVNLSFHFWVAGGAVCNTKSNTLLDPDKKKKKKEEAVFMDIIKQRGSRDKTTHLNSVQN